ncbi:MAG TPA: dihydrolipoamide acetyltransferase family protein [Gaiellaceae bacterium]|nr:dihydrolipoamide acetyltransferase family protein [Gaiellaceae bacterium]
MAYEFKLPDLGEGLTEGEIARWLVTEGQEIAEDDPLVEIQTDKTTVEIPSPAAGTVAQILVAEGAVVPVGTVLVVIGSDGDTAMAAPAVVAAPPRAATPAPELASARPDVPSGRIQATPLVRRLAAELGVELARLNGSGPNGRIVEADVRAAGGGEVGPDQPEASEGRREPVRGVRRVIVAHLTRAHREVPAVTFVEECDFTGIDTKQLLPLVLKATAAALAEYPELNARLERGGDGGEEIVYLDRYDLGIAVQTEQGLVVPVVRGCDTASLEEIAAEIARLAEAARAGSLKPDELRGSTFTVTSAGKLSGLFVTPLVNHPEVGILGIHRIGPRPVVRDGEVVVRQVGNVSVTFDHRVVDGARAAAFTLDVIARLQ